MPKIVLIEPRSPNLHIFSKFPSPRLGTVLLGTIMKERGWDVELFVEDFRSLDFGIIGGADMVGISTITSTAPRAYAIAERIRPLGVPVLFGGPHVTFLSEEALGHGDFVLRGEAEETLPAFLEAWRAGADLTGIPGLSFRKNGAFVHNPKAVPPHDLDAFPVADFDLLKPDRRWRNKRMVLPVQTSRGCPFDCTFCSVTGMFGKTYRFRSTGHILEELRRHSGRKKYLFFYDDNFAAHKPRTKELLEAMIREGFKFKWTTQVRADVARDPALVRLMKKAGCHTVCIGFESVNPKSLQESHKAQSVEELNRAVRVFRRNRIHIHGMFVFGFDQDDRGTVRETVAWARKHRLTSSQFLILTPLPGSEFFNKVTKEERIAFKDWSLYDAHHAVFRPRRFSLAELQKAQIWGHRKFYSFKEQVRNLLEGRWMALAINQYARTLNRTWKKRNRTYLKVLDLLRPRRGSRIRVDYRQDVGLD
ncbi:MAG: B12-binding domain-containing radical SAM protein [Candidatus Aminicenantes bacterium]|nr:B12-binding domain-containing radical SAM protein [Candidatus Aminicenantes bacterium]